MNKQAPTFDQVCDWCEAHDNHAAEGWLCLLLDGTYSVDELRAAILAERSPELLTALDAASKSLDDQVLDLPAYRGWYVTRADDRDMVGRFVVEKIVWKHEDCDTKIWLDIVRKSRDQIDLAIDVADPNDDPYHPRGEYATLPEHTAAAVFAACKPFLDEYALEES